MPLVISSFFFIRIIVIKFAPKKAKNLFSINDFSQIPLQIHTFLHKISKIFVYVIFFYYLCALNN